MKRTHRLILGFAAAVIMGVAISVLSLQHISATRIPAPPAITPAPHRMALLTLKLPISSGDTLADLLARSGEDRADDVAMIAAIKKVFNVKDLRAGTQLTLTRTASGNPQSMDYLIDPDHELHVSKVDGSFVAKIEKVPGTIHDIPVCGTLQGSLFASMHAIGESPDLAVRMAGIFQYDVDFYTDPREGDEFCLLIEKKQYRNGHPATVQRILAAKYDNAGTVYEAFLFPDADGTPQYYSSNGHSLQSLFLRSPMKFDARISSHFSRHRFHPILKIYRPHLGTDYAAPRGTPVQAVAAGRVIYSGYDGGAGNLIKIRHANGYETMYMHLSRRLVHVGQSVKQGQRIGLVGATGLATGPHLDFRVRKNGRYLNFEHLKLPRATTIRARRRPAFDATRDRFLALMDSASRPNPNMLASDTSAKGNSATP